MYVILTYNFYYFHAAVVTFDRIVVSRDSVLREPESVNATNIVLVISKPVDQDAIVTVRTTDISATGEI